MLLSVRRYRIFGLSIESHFDLPGARETSVGGQPDITVVREGPPVDAGATARIRLEAPNAERPSIADLRDGSTAMMWSDALQFIVSPARDRIRVVGPDASLVVVPRMLVGLVLGYVLHLRGRLCLHGAVLTREGRAISLLGASGAGKSTLAAALVLGGAALVSDDLTVVRHTPSGVLAEPGCTALRLPAAVAARLLGDTAQLPRVPLDDKLMWHPRCAEHATPLETLYVLEQSSSGNGGSDIGAPLARNLALQRLVGAWYPPHHARLLTPERLADLSTLAAEIPVRVVRYARTWEQLPQLVERLSE